ncbi:hypothetical protein LJR290_007929 [Variovorax sp. LjRoot290]|uniref:hypothetical protein n=1 Tax=Variovorax sp. LjRoot290 TaxID=3342316 RepID=UPI003ECFC657
MEELTKMEEIQPGSGFQVRTAPADKLPRRERVVGASMRFTTSGTLERIVSIIVAPRNGSRNKDQRLIVAVPRPGSTASGTLRGARAGAARR